MGNTIDFILAFFISGYLILSCLTSITIYKACDDIGVIRSTLLALTISPLAMIHKLCALGSILGCMLWGVSYNELSQSVMAYASKGGSSSD